MRLRRLFRLVDGVLSLSTVAAPISHLFFADDLVLFGEADEQQVNVINEILDEYTYCSGHRVSALKSQVYFSANTDEDTKNQLSTLMGFEQVEDLGMYLGVPLFHKRVTIATYEFVLDKVRNMLNGWDAKLLSHAGRVPLAKSALLTIPGYFMQTAALPKHIGHEIEKLARNFVWGSTNEDRKQAAVKWDDMCQPMERGGLGFRHVTDQNKAFLLKLGYKIVTDV